MRRTRRTQQGMTFVVTLGIMVALVAVVAAAAVSQRARFQALLTRVEKDKARWAAEAGLQRALAELSLIQAGQPASLEDEWAQLGQRGEELFVLGDESFRVGIVDAGSRINLNTASLDQLQRLPFTQEQIDSLLDWREPGTTPRTEGAKDEYYNNLANPYQAGLRRLSSFDELLSVRGFTARALFEPQEDVVSTATIVQGSSDQQPTLYQLAGIDSFSPQTTPTGQTRLNVNGGGTNPGSLTQRGIPTQIAAQIFQRRPFTRLGDVVAVAGANRQAQRAILDELTVTGQTRSEGKINLNTADEAVLNSIPNLPPDVVQAILSRQLQGFQQLSDILDVPGMTGATLTQTVDAFTVQSGAFWVRVEGRTGSLRESIEALVTLDANGPRLIRIEHPPFGDMSVRWGWPEEATTETDLSGDSR
ncbi:MAG TPA: type II secretion system protein GspK [Fimbriimonadaceae bacterium]|nr:type II secretion system protein GspK [Fimbriimonadaceae bacterium]